MSYCLLEKRFVPVQSPQGRIKVSLLQVLCGEVDGWLCLPRDDFEMACLQLLVTITQVCFTPPDQKALFERLKKPLTQDEYLAGIEGKKEWFDLDHPETPFMQFRGVKSKDSTPMDKLLAGVADGTNKTFVNPDGLATGLCRDCVSVALFNQANNCPSMGGGFKGGLRGSTPITQLIKGPDLRRTIWLNVMHREWAQRVMPWYETTADQRPNYVDGVRAGEVIQAATIGLNRGLLWQPARFELLVPETVGRCSLCYENADLYTGFNKEKFNYTVEGVWPHPLSARTFKVAKGKREEKFQSFTTTAPGWTHLSRLTVAKSSEKEGQIPAPVLQQLQDRLSESRKLQFTIGGYQNNQATILDRRHEFFSLAHGWAEHSAVIDKIVEIGLGHKTALRKALWLFAEGIRDKIPGSGVNLCVQGDTLYFQQTEEEIVQSLGKIDFADPWPVLKKLQVGLRSEVLQLFEQFTQPYRREPKMLKALALARRSLNKSLAELVVSVEEE